MPKNGVDNPKKCFVVYRATQEEFDKIEKTWKELKYPNRSEFLREILNSATQ